MNIEICLKGQCDIKKISYGQSKLKWHSLSYKRDTIQTIYSNFFFKIKCEKKTSYIETVYLYT